MKQYGLLLLVPLVFLGYFLFQSPFAHEIVVRHTAVSGLSQAQHMNIRMAADHLNGAIVRPGEVFSFNRSVGPRTRARGYAAAPSYLDTQSPATVGGGICLLSSLLYQAALSAGLDITARVPHLRTIRSVPPGLDAAVWYGQVDLAFQNTLPFPVRIQTAVNSQNLTVRIMGAKPLQTYTLDPRVMRQTKSQLQVTVFRQSGQNRILVSRDLYRVTP